MTDDHVPTKRCAKCGEYKPVTLFSKNKQHPDGFQTRCKACVRLENQGYRQKNGEAMRAKQRERYHKNPATELERQRVYHRENADSIRQRRRHYNMTHADVIWERNRRYRADNAEAIREKHLAYRAAHADVTEKLCPRCNQIKPLASFSKSEDKKDGYKTHCKECRSLEGQAYRRANADLIREYKQNYQKTNAEAISEYKRIYHENNRDRWSVAQQYRRARVRNNGGSFTAQELSAMRAAQNGVCAYCRRQLNPQALTIDHVIPLLRGGRHEAANIVLACGVCNRSKGARCPEEWLNRWYERPSWHG